MDAPGSGRQKLRGMSPCIHMIALLAEHRSRRNFRATAENCPKLGESGAVRLGPGRSPHRTDADTPRPCGHPSQAGISSGAAPGPSSAPHPPLASRRPGASLGPVQFSGPIRLERFLAGAGLCSRRAARALIAAGEVSVNGQPAVLGAKVSGDADRVAVRGRPVESRQPRVTLAMHKPRGLICSNRDPHHARTVFSALPPPWSGHRFFCAGRLDQDSEGLLILTTDGDLAQRLTHPSHRVVKRYQVSLDRDFPRAQLARLLRGVVVEGEHFQVEHASLVHPGPGGGSSELDVHLHHGKKREIRQLFRALGYRVRRLRRYQIGGLRLQGLPAGAVKSLTDPEVRLLFRAPPPHPD